MTRPRYRTIMAALLLIALAAIMFSLAGCGSMAPVHIACRGKGVLAFQGGPYAGTVQGDCGDGFEYIRSSPEK
jgi:hypothetical protein